jgi:hypothetical protein
MPLRYLFVICAILSTLQPVRGFARQTPGLPAANHPVDTLRDGSHDFDFNVGNWHTHIRRRLHPFTDSSTWIEMQGTVRIQKVWNGKAQLEEIEVDGPVGHWEGATLFLYNPASHEWSQNFTSSSDGDISNPTIGRFKDGVGALYTQETQASLHGQSVMVRGVWSDITADSHSYTESLTRDGGKTWLDVFVTHLTRDTATPGSAAFTVPKYPPEAPGQHDFDFAMGTWKEHSSRILQPLTGSTTWVEMNGISVAKKFMNGRGNITELESDGPNGHLELLALRLYNAQTQEWNLTFATSKGGVLGMPPCIGEFKNGRGEFYDQEQYNGRTIWVRFTITALTSNTFRSEQAFSVDGGKTWETNWINSYTRA